MAKYVKYQLGDLFAVPLERGEYGVIAAVRRVPRPNTKRTALVTVCGFDRVFEKVPVAEDVVALTPTDVCVYCFLLDDYIVEGAYPKVGEIPGFRNDLWLVPPERAGKHNACFSVNEGGYGDINFDLSPFLTASEMELLPWMGGMCGPNVLRSHLDDAIRGYSPEDVKRRADVLASGVFCNQLPPPRFVVTDDHIKLWRRLIRQLLDAGVIESAAC